MEIPTKDQLPQKVLRDGVLWKDLYFYQKVEALYRSTYMFCRRYLPQYGDRTVDRMIQAARSGKQNIVEGLEDGRTSTEMELRLLNVARSSFQELREDYEDYAGTRNLLIRKKGHPRYSDLVQFCRRHNSYDDYAPYIDRWDAEEFCNVALSLCHITDSMMSSYLARLEKTFVEEGGIKERMYAARTGDRRRQDEELSTLRREDAALRAELDKLRSELATPRDTETARDRKSVPGNPGNPGIYSETIQPV